MYGYRQEDVKKQVMYANCALKLEHKIVAMKFLFTEEEFEIADAPKLNSKMSYCNMVIKAGEGKSMKADIDNFGCFGGARALGIVKCDEYYLDGRFFEPRGLYQDLATSREVTSHIHRCSHHIKGIMVKPLDEFTCAPDVVLFVSNPRNIMRLIQGYTYHYGVAKNIKMIGNQAICAEATAHPYLENDMNVSCLCNGPRTAGMNDNEMALGIVYNRFSTLIDGLCMTITAIEHNPRKEEIKKKFDENGVDKFPIQFSRNYGHPFFNRDFQFFMDNEKEYPRKDEPRFTDIFE